jgi:ribosomal protein S18 acetylase RimI-like enzyme
VSGDVRGLSNLFRGRPRTSGAVSEPPATDADQAGLRLALSTGNQPVDARAARDFLRSTAARGGKVVSVQTIYEQDKPAWAVVAVLMPGRAAMVLLGNELSQQHEAAAAVALRAALQDAADAGAELAQSLLPGKSETLARLLLDAGYETAATLAYLQKIVEPKRRRTRALPAGYRLVDRTRAFEEDVAEAVAASYEDTLDCPRLTGSRPMPDVLEGHRAAGLYRPEWWHVLYDPIGPCGVCLCSGLGERGEVGIELVYLGLSPRARGLGLAPALFGLAEEAAAATTGRLLALAVDAQNTPAIRLYEKYDMQLVQTRLAFVRDLNAA